ncbi:MAG: hypothetical protein IJO46_01645, partial [Thermoguttaceae bacterium]|nr:hypothetical protein [Thermoguttaceae bacterium]
MLWATLTRTEAVVVVVLFPCVGILEKIACAIVKDRPEEGEDKKELLPEPIARLEQRFIQHPTLALEQSHQAIDAMADLAQQSLQDAFDLLHNYTDEGFRKVRKAEKEVDIYEDKLGAYIVQISARELTKKQNEQIYE